MYDVIVVGAGVNGSASAYHLVKQGANVLLLDQFPTPHTRGSSHGQTRVIRCTYYDEILSFLSRDSFPLWRELEKEVDEELFIQNGYLEVFDQSAEDVVNFKRGCRVLDAVGAEYRLLSGNEVNEQFPPFNFPGTCRGIYEPGGGTVLASKCVNAFHRAFVKRGGTFKDGEIVEKVIPGDVVTIVTRKGEYKAKSVIITAGSFTSTLTSALGLNLPLEVERVHPCYWKTGTSSIGTIQSGFPSWKAMHMVYGLPVFEYPGLMKICGHWGKPMDENFTEVGPDYYSTIQMFIKTYMKDVSTIPSVVEECSYTVTPDNFFIIDVHPTYRNIVIGAGFSGGGFKMAPVTGSILGDLALGKEVAYDISAFRICRFDGVITPKSRL